MGFLSNVIARLTEHAADLDAHTYNPFERLPVGVYLYSPLLASYDLSTARAFGASGRIFAWPFPLARAITIDRLVAHIKTAEAGKSARVGIYRDTGSCYPGVLVKDGGEVSIATNGTKAISLTPNVSLTKDLYWMAIITDSTTGEISTGLQHNCLLGSTSGDTSVQACFKKDDTYGAMPDPFPSGASQWGYMAAIGIRVASLD